MIKIIIILPMVYMSSFNLLYFAGVGYVVPLQFIATTGTVDLSLCPSIYTFRSNIARHTTNTLCSGYKGKTENDLIDADE